MTILLYILLIMTFLSTIGGIALLKQASGPEGPIGACIVFVIPCILITIMFLIFAAKGMMHFIPGGRPVQFIAAVGIIIVFGISLFGSVDHGDSIPQKLLLVLSFLLLAGSIFVIHQINMQNKNLANWIGIILFGGGALIGWGLTCKALFFYMQKSLNESIMQAEEEDEWEGEFIQKQADEYAALETDSPLFKLLGFTVSANKQVQQDARNRVKSYPKLDEQLIELLDVNNEEAIKYIANAYETPPATLAPAWGKLLERKLKTWDSLQYDEHAGKWELNLRDYFDGAKKIQDSGGNMKPQLQLWHDHLKKCKGLGNLTDFVKTLL
jgi:hypothetical protein